LIDQHGRTGNPKAFTFPVSRMPEYQFSYSGVKTSFLYFLQEKQASWIASNLSDICASIQEALLEPIVNAGRKALREFATGSLGIAGGVAANSALRIKLAAVCAEEKAGFYFPPMEFCTDNAGMIGLAAQFKFHQQLFSGFSVSTRSRLAIGDN
jgi:N6-L-threonylcarbamoyladenine synthase